MSITYSVIAGDTFSSIARETLGDDNLADFIASANPGVAEPLTEGLAINVPDVPGAPQDLTQQAPSVNLNDVALLISGARFRFWGVIVITRTLDAMDTVLFSAPFDADDDAFKSMFKPFSYADVVVTVGGEPLFKGTMIGVDPTVDAGARSVQISAYSLPGILADCTPFASSFPIEFNEVGLKEVVEKLIEPFGIAVTFNADAGAVFERVAIDPGKNILAFISNLARQRNLVVTSSPQGELIFEQSSDTGSPVAVLRQGESPLTSVTALFNPRAYFSHITGIEPVLFGADGSQFTVKNPFLQGRGRPFTYNVTDTQSADVKVSVDAKMGRMFANVASYAITVSTWRDPDGNLWKPNTTLILSAPDAMIYKDFEFVIRSVTLIKDSDSETAELTLIIPGSFSGKIPGAVPWAV